MREHLVERTGDRRISLENLTELREDWELLHQRTRTNTQNFADDGGL
ncbi:MAG: hypothetical protein WCC92_02770 [Candidatus Korobacteraceae bacterium]